MRKLETMNEELQSTNEELQTINEEARERGDQLGEVDGFLESILTSLRSAVAVVDRDLHGRKSSRRAENLWGLRSDEVIQKNFSIWTWARSGGFGRLSGPAWPTSPSSWT